MLYEIQPEQIFEQYINKILNKPVVVPPSCGICCTQVGSAGSFVCFVLESCELFVECNGGNSNVNSDGGHGL